MLLEINVPVKHKHSNSCHAMQKISESETDVRYGDHSGTMRAKALELL